MPDRLNLSLWLRGFNKEVMLRRFEELLRVFPFSRLRSGISALRIYAIEFAEPALFEEGFGEDAGVDAAIAACREFENPDCAYVVEGWWDLLHYDKDWQLTPSPVSLTCFGPDFANELGDHLRLEFGNETVFLPRADVPQGVRKTQSNLKSLVRLMHDLREALPADRQSLWSESGEDFAERLEELSDEAAD